MARWLHSGGIKMIEKLLIKNSIDGIDLTEYCGLVCRLANRRDEICQELLLPISIQGKQVFSEQVRKQSLMMVNPPVFATPWGALKVYFRDDVPDDCIYISLKSKHVNSYKATIMSYKEYSHSIAIGFTFVGTVINKEFGTVIGQYVSDDLDDLKVSMVDIANNCLHTKEKVSTEDIELGFKNKSIKGPHGVEELCFGYEEVPINRYKKGE